MRTTILVFCIFAMFTAACAEETLVTISWDKLKTEGRLTAGQVIPAGESAELKLTNLGPSPVTIVEIPKPGVKGSSYALIGRARWENVAETAYLEMWSVFPDGQRFYSRATEGGPTPIFTGSSGWRDIMLPFNLMGSGEKPSRIILNIFMPGRGVVHLSSLRLVEPAPGPFGVTQQGIRLIPLLGPIAGIFSTFVGLFAVVTVFLVLRGKARRFVLAMWFIFLGIGIAFLIVAQAIREPPFVHYPLLLTGIIHTALAAIAVIVIRKQYERWEFRRMIAQDAGLSEHRKQD